MYYYEPECFDKCGAGHVISEDKRTVTRSVYGSWNSTVYCRQWINSNTNNIITWTFKIIRNQDSAGIAMGICCDDNCLSSDFQGRSSPPSYSFCTNGYRFVDMAYQDARECEKIFKEGNIVSIILNLKQAKLCIKLDDNQEVKDLITNITKRDDVRYKFAIAITTENDCIELMNYQLIECKDQCEDK